MEPDSTIDDSIAALEAQIRECFGRVVYATKTHEKSADLCVTKLHRIKFWQILLSALTTSGLLAAIFGGDKLSHPAAVAAAVVSMALLALNTYAKDSDLGQRAERHKKTASELWDVRESYFSILTDLKDGSINREIARAKRDKLQARLASSYETAPRTSSKAYADASVGLKEREELTFSDAEIDAFLPESLRRGS